MQDHQVQTHITRILAGRVNCYIGNRCYICKQPNIYLLHDASEIASQVREDSRFFALSEEALIEYLIEIGLWSDKEEERLTTIPKLIETMKLQIWQAYKTFKSKQLRQLKKQIVKSRIEWLALYNKRNQYINYLPSGLAHIARIEYLVEKLIDQPELTGINIHSLAQQYSSNQLSEDELRQIAKTDAWKTIWSCAKTQGALLNISPSCWTHEQQSLVAWSRMYDHIYENIDCPPDEVVEDDLLLDGWLVTQSKKRDKDRREKLGDHFKSDKPGIQEVFIPAETPEDAQRIHEMNSPQARIEKRQRERLILNKGKVAEEKMPDAQLVMRQQALEQFRNRVKKKG